jgi:hypothetical protein
MINATSNTPTELGRSGGTRVLGSHALSQISARIETETAGAVNRHSSRHRRCDGRSRAAWLGAKDGLGADLDRCPGRLARTCECRLTSHQKADADNRQDRRQTQAQSAVRHPNGQQAAQDDAGNGPDQQRPDETEIDVTQPPVAGTRDQG